MTLRSILSTPFKSGAKISKPALVTAIAVIIAVVVAVVRIPGLSKVTKTLGAMILLVYGFIQVYAIRCLDDGNCGILAWLVAIAVTITFLVAALTTSMLKGVITKAEDRLHSWNKKA
jgi:hypothetical protein